MNNLRTSPLSSCNPLVFMVHLLHRLYGVDAPVPLHCCQNLTLPNVPTRRLLPGNPTTAALVVFAFLFRPIDPISNGFWELGIELQ